MPWKPTNIQHLGALLSHPKPDLLAFKLNLNCPTTSNSVFPLMEKSHSLVLLSLLLLITMAAGTQFKVGGSGIWAVPTEPKAMSYNQWAESNRFQIEDSILFVYRRNEDSVLLVDMNAYKSCNTSSFIDAFNDGNTMFTFTRSGPFYFISGNRDNCLKNESMVVVVLGKRSLPPSASPPSIIEITSPPPGSELASPPPPPSGAPLRLGSFLGSVLLLLGSLVFAS